jgi:hypothetical protein
MIHLLLHSQINLEPHHSLVKELSFQNQTLRPDPGRTIEFSPYAGQAIDPCGPLVDPEATLLAFANSAVVSGNK